MVSMKQGIDIRISGLQNGSRLEDRVQLGKKKRGLKIKTGQADFVSLVCVISTVSSRCCLLFSN